MVCDSIVLHVRVGSGPKLGFGGSGSAWGDGEWCGGQRRGPGQRHGQRLPVVFKRAELPVQILQLSVLLCLQGHHLFDVSTKIKERKHQYGKRGKEKQHCRIQILSLLSQLVEFSPQIFILHLALIIAAAQRQVRVTPGRVTGRCSSLLVFLTSFCFRFSPLSLQVR